MNITLTLNENELLIASANGVLTELAKCSIETRAECREDIAERMESAKQMIDTAPDKEPVKTEPVKAEVKKTVSVDELAKKAHSLIEKNGNEGQQKLVNLLNDFKVASLPELTAEQRVQFAEKLDGVA